MYEWFRSLGYRSLIGGVDRGEKSCCVWENQLQMRAELMGGATRCSTRSRRARTVVRSAVVAAVSPDQGPSRNGNAGSYSSAFRREPGRVRSRVHLHARAGTVSLRETLALLEERAIPRFTTVVHARESYAGAFGSDLAELGEYDQVLSELLASVTAVA